MAAPTTSFDHSSLIRHTSSLDHQQQSNFTDGVRQRQKYSTRQLLLIFSYIYGNFFLAACVSLQAPFFPKEAEKKGASPTEYGLVFGVYEIAIIVVSPLVGKFIGSSSPKFWIQSGLILTGVMTVAFGFLDKVPNGPIFIILAFLIRILEGVGAASFTTPCYTATAEEFPQDQASILSFLETAFGMGLICGPTLGGWLYNIGNYVLPFLSLGVLLIIGAILNLLATTGQKPIPIDPTQPQAQYLKILLAPGIILDALCVITSLAFIGYNAATLEPHLRQFNLSVMTVGFIFVITGSIYAITTPVWGKVSKHLDTKILSVLGCFLCLGGFAMIGPLPFIKTNSNLAWIILALVLIGVGTAIKLVSALVGSFRHAIYDLGMPDNKSTFGICSSIYHTSTSIGAFLGPSLGGFLLETIGYRSSTYFLFGFELVLIIGLIWFIIFKKYCLTFSRPLIVEDSEDECSAKEEV